MGSNTKYVGTLPEYEEVRPSIRAALGALDGAAEALAVLTDQVGDRSALGAFLVPEHGAEGGVRVLFYLDGEFEESVKARRDAKRRGMERASRRDALDRYARILRSTGWRVAEVYSARTATERLKHLVVHPPALEDLTGPLDSGMAEFLADTFVAYAEGSAVAVRADRLAVGMDVIAAVRLETRTVGTVKVHTGPGAPWVRVTWQSRDLLDSVMGDRRVLDPGFLLVVTVASLTRLFGPLPGAPSEEAVRKARTRAWMFAGKWVAETEYRRASGLPNTPTNEALSAAFAACAKPPTAHLYPLIRHEISTWDTYDGRRPADRH
ncbi:hypothetical protein [Streptomyces sp. NPDC002547]